MLLPASAQDTLYAFWPEETPELLLGKVLSPTPKDESLQKYGYEGFYKKGKRQMWVGYDDSQDKYYAEMGKVKYDLIIGKKFMVNNIERDTQDKYESISGPKWWFYMTDVETGEEVRFHYKSKYEHQMVLSLTEEMQYPENWFCKGFTTKKDKFTGKTTVYTDFRGPITFTKVIEGDYISYFMRLEVGGETLNTGEKGVFLILDDGEILTFPDESIDTKVNDSEYGGRWIYTAFMSMDQNLIDKLSEHYVTDIRLYIYDSSPSETYAKQRRAKLKCLVSDLTYE